MTIRTCKVCQNTMDLDKFYLTNNKFKTIRHTCIECERERRRKYNKKVYDKKKEKLKEMKEQKENLIKDI